MAKSKHPRRLKSRPQHAVAGGPRERPASASRAMPAQGPSPGSSRRPLLLWGIHAVRAALANPKRNIAAGWATPSTQTEVAKARPGAPVIAWTAVTAAQLTARLPDGAVHQGTAIEVEPLPRVSLDTVLAPEAPASPVPGPLVVLDRVTDPHNVGAILRSCAAFGAAALLTTTAMRRRNRAHWPKPLPGRSMSSPGCGSPISPAHWRLSGKPAGGSPAWTAALRRQLPGPALPTAIQKRLLYSAQKVRDFDGLLKKTAIFSFVFPYSMQITKSALT